MIPTLTKEHAPKVLRNGATGIERIDAVRLGPGFGVWRVETSCKRSDAMVGYIGGTDGAAVIHYLPQEDEPEYVDLSQHEERPVPGYLTEVELRLPTQDRSDHWIVETVWDKYGGWIVAFLALTVGEFMTPEQIKAMRGES